MRHIILGGAPAGDWTPLLIPVIAVAVLLFSIDYSVKFLKNRRIHNKKKGE